MAERVSDERVTYAAKHPEDAFNLDEGADAEGVAAFVLDLRDCRAERDALRALLQEASDDLSNLRGEEARDNPVLRRIDAALARLQEE